ncbi:MAG: carbohydrate-binding protein [Hamadaea sp.]|uniref:CBM35 domain-containing protein n=1 Tax=Hamadaea sp. TaxID=2024425 RepID=UPI0018483FAA|nr:CBM35 domain-containing protein [Hamadaea sp.]NUT20839.1 carbohydrate-binding protein [Hamadaea sp.]
MRPRRLLHAALAITTGVLLAGAVGQPAFAATYNVKNYGATGNGSTNDSAAIQKAVDAAAAAGGGIVQFPSGTYKSANTIHLKSNITVQLDAGSTVVGSSADTYDPPEPNQWDAYQDYGHSHFHNAMFYGDRLTNIGFTGTGTLDGGGNLITGNPASGEADKIISLTRCDGLVLNDITLRRGGHFAILTNNCNNITSDHLKIFTATDRDAWNIISATNVTITNGDINGNDDAIVFKSDYALGAKLPNGHVRVTDTHASAGCCNALMFGSETCGDFTDYVFERISITGANKSGLGMVSMDGANISDVHYKDITMSGVSSPIMQKIGTRRRCGNSPGIGHISNITYENVTGVGKSSPVFSPTLWGEAGGNQISDVTFTNVHLTVPGGSAAVSTGVPSNDPTNYNPNSIGTRPAYGWYVHNANNISFIDSSVDFQSNDNRPAVIANTASNLKFTNFTAERGTGSAYDVGFQSVGGYCVTGQNTTGGTLRVNAAGSTENCVTTPPPGRYEAEDATYSPGVFENTHTGYSGTGYVNSDNVLGAYVQWNVQADAAGPHTLKFRYANGTTADRPMDITVNGTTVATAVAFPPTANWDTWATITVTTALTAGANTVRASATTAGGDPNLDYVDVAIAAPPPTRYEAENAVISQGVVEANHLGFSGTGFVNTDNITGSYVEWTVNAATAGPATLRIAYANGTTASRPAAVSVNGTVVATPSFAVTTNWDTWVIASVPVTLAAGANTVRVTATTSGGCANLDYLDV